MSEKLCRGAHEKCCLYIVLGNFVSSTLYYLVFNKHSVMSTLLNTKFKNVGSLRNQCQCTHAQAMSYCPSLNIHTVAIVCSHVVL